MPRPATSARRDRVVLWSLIVAYAATFSILSAIKYANLLYNDIDLAIFVQACDRLLHGSLYSSIRGMNWLGDHSSLNLFLVAPLYAIARHPLTLLVVQSVALALGALPVYALARRELEDRGAALIFAAVYLLYPALGDLNLFEFHPEALSTTPLLAAFYFTRAGRTGWAATFAGLALLGKEDAALVVLALAVYAWLQPERRRVAAAFAGLAVASLVVSFGFLKPMLGGHEAEYGRMYEQWGTSAGGVVAGLARNPVGAITALFATPGDAADTIAKQQYYAHLLLPLAFLPLLGLGTLAIALPIMAEHLLSSRTQQHSILYQYAAFVIPFVIAAAVVGTGSLARRAKGSVRPAALAALALLTSLAANWMFGPVLGHGVLQARHSIQHVFPSPMDRATARYARAMLARVPKRGGVVAGFGFLPALAGRDSVHALHHVVSGKYTYSTRDYPIPSGITAVLGDFAQDRLLPYVTIDSTATRLQHLLGSNRLAPAEIAGDLMLFLHDAGAAPPPVERLAVEPSPGAVLDLPMIFDHVLVLEGWLVPDDGVVPGGLLVFATTWRRLSELDRIYMTQWVLLDASGGAALDHVRDLGGLIDPASGWPGGKRMLERESLIVPEDVRPGVYELAMRLGWRGDRTTGLATINGPPPPADGLVRLGPVTILPTSARRR